GGNRHRYGRRRATPACAPVLACRAEHADDRRRGRRQRPHHPVDGRQSLRQLPAAPRLLLGLQPDSRRQQQIAAACTAAAARAPPVPGRLAAALLRLPHRGDRRWPRRRHARSRCRSETRLGIAPSRPLPGRSQYRGEGTAAARARPGPAQRRARDRSAPPRPPARGRPRPPACAAVETAALRAAGRPPSAARARRSAGAAREAGAAAAAGIAVRRGRLMARWTARVDPPWDLDAWRDIARHALRARVPPEDIDWQDGNAPAALLAAPDLRGAPTTRLIPRASSALLGIAGDVLCHRDPQRLGLLYRLLWRINHGEPTVLSNPADADVRRAQALA